MEDLVNLVLEGLPKSLKIGFFWKKIKNNEDYASYKDEEIFPSYSELIDSILSDCKDLNKKEYNCIKQELLDYVKDCKDALSVCDNLKKLLKDYDETCDMEIDICFTSVF